MDISPNFITSAQGSSHRGPTAWLEGPYNPNHHVNIRPDPNKVEKSQWFCVRAATPVCGIDPLPDGSALMLLYVQTIHNDWRWMINPPNTQDAFEAVCQQHPSYKNPGLPLFRYVPFIGHIERHEHDAGLPLHRAVLLESNETATLRTGIETIDAIKPYLSFEKLGRSYLAPAEYADNPAQDPFKPWEAAIGTYAERQAQWTRIARARFPVAGALAFKALAYG